jgi:hypothetical protein
MKNRRVRSNVIQGGSPFKLIIRNMGSGIKKSMLYVQDVRYFAIEHMEKVRPGTGLTFSRLCTLDSVNGTS